MLCGASPTCVAALQYRGDGREPAAMNIGERRLTTYPCTVEYHNLYIMYPCLVENHNLYIVYPCLVEYQNLYITYAMYRMQYSTNISVVCLAV